MESSKDLKVTRVVNVELLNKTMAKLWPELEAIVSSRIEECLVYLYVDSGPDISIGLGDDLIAIFRRSQFNTVDDVKKAFGSYNAKLKKAGYITYRATAVDEQIMTTSAMVDLSNVIREYLDQCELVKTSAVPYMRFSRPSAHEEAQLIAELEEIKCKSKSTVKRKKQPIESSNRSKKKVSKH